MEGDFAEQHLPNVDALNSINLGNVENTDYTVCFIVFGKSYDKNDDFRCYKLQLMYKGHSTRYFILLNEVEHNWLMKLLKTIKEGDKK